MRGDRMKFIIRQEQKEGYLQTEEVVKKAFENESYSDQSEHTLVAKLRKSEAFVPDLSLVAVNEDKIIEHILLSKILIDTEDKKVESLALAPISVLPEYQNKGVGQKLIQQALTIAESLDFESVMLWDTKHIIRNLVSKKHLIGAYKRLLKYQMSY